MILRFVLGLLIIVNIAGSVLECRRSRLFFYAPEKASFIEAVDWVKRNASPEECILSRFPSWLHLYSNGYRGVKFLTTTDAEAQYRNIKRHKIRYVIIDQNKIYRDDAGDYLFPLVRHAPHAFELVYTSSKEPKTYVYKVKDKI